MERMYILVFMYKCVCMCVFVYVCSRIGGGECWINTHFIPPNSDSLPFAVYLYLAVALSTLPVCLLQSVHDSNSTCLSSPIFFFAYFSLSLSLTPLLLLYPLLLFPCLISQWINLEAGYQSVTNGP